MVLLKGIIRWFPSCRYHNNRSSKETIQDESTLEILQVVCPSCCASISSVWFDLKYVLDEGSYEYYDSNFFMCKALFGTAGAPYDSLDIN